jgi:hypothetical protein
MHPSLTRPALRRAAAVIAILALAIAAAAILVGAPATAKRSKPPAPRLMLVRRDPATVIGRHFAPRARVHVGVASGPTLTRNPMTDRRGTFTVVFPTIVDRCSSITITASQKHHRTVVLAAKPECPPL